MKDLVSAIVVDDSVSMRRYVSTLLQGGLGIDVVLEAANADDAMNLIRSNPDLNIRCVLSDLEMPGMDAREFLMYLRENPQTSHVPCVLLSARQHHVAESIALRNGFTDYLSKPFSPELFVEKMSRIWSGKERRRARRVAPRIACDTDLTFGDADVQSVELVNISMTGCLVRAPVPELPSMQVYDSVMIRLSYSDNQVMILHGRIIRVEKDAHRCDENLAAVAFNFMTPDEYNRRKLGDYIGQCE